MSDEAPALKKARGEPAFDGARLIRDFVPDRLLKLQAGVAFVLLLQNDQRESRRRSPAWDSSDGKETRADSSKTVARASSSARCAPRPRPLPASYARISYWVLRVVETSLEASDDRECAGKPRDRDERVGSLDRCQIGCWKRPLLNSRAKCKSLLSSGPTRVPSVSRWRDWVRVFLTRVGIKKAFGHRPSREPRSSNSNRRLRAPTRCADDNILKTRTFFFLKTLEKIGLAARFAAFAGARALESLGRRVLVLRRGRPADARAVLARVPVACLVGGQCR